MPVLPPNQQRQSTEGLSTEGEHILLKYIGRFDARVTVLKSPIQSMN